MGEDIKGMDILRIAVDLRSELNSTARSRVEDSDEMQVAPVKATEACRCYPSTSLCALASEAHCQLVEVQDHQPALVPIQAARSLNSDAESEVSRRSSHDYDLETKSV